jgi:hypothetical protein
VFELVSQNPTRLNYNDVDLIVKCYVGSLSVEEINYLSRLIVNYFRKNLIKSDSYDIVDYVQQRDTVVVLLVNKEYNLCD